jgi:hypothetical protein
MPAAKDSSSNLTTTNTCMSSIAKSVKMTISQLCVFAARSPRIVSRTPKLKLLRCQRRSSASHIPLLHDHFGLDVSISYFIRTSKCALCGVKFCKMCR